MYLTTQEATTTVDKHVEPSFSEGALSADIDRNDLQDTLKAKVNGLSERCTQTWVDERGGSWQCIGSDYSVQYKRLHKRFYALHENELTFDLHRLTTVDEYKVADVTRCSYVMQEDQCVRVSVHATLVFKQ